VEILDEIQKYTQEDRELFWEGTFTEYLEMVIRKPHIARLSHARIYDMIMAAGVEEGETNKV